MRLRRDLMPWTGFLLFGCLRFTASNMSHIGLGRRGNANVALTNSASGSKFHYLGPSSTDRWRDGRQDTMTGSGDDMLLKSLRASTAIALILMAQYAVSRPALAGGPVLQPEAIEPEVIQPRSFGTKYVGVQIGCSWLDEDDGIQSENGPCSTVGGVHLGYNVSNGGNFVWGGELELGVSNHEFGGPASGGATMSTDWEASVRLRLGYMMNDMTMLYGAGGVAFVGAEMEGGGSNTHTGWTVGLGIERSLSENWLGRFEVRHNDYGAETYNGPSGPIDVDFGNTQAVFGLSYKF